MASVRRSQRICPVCGTEFRPRTWNQRFCVGRGQCYRRAVNAAYRDRPLQLGKVGEPFDCAECSKRCTPGENRVAAHATRFCGRDCKRRWHKRKERARELAA